jgi:hypothetical protein
MEALFKRRIRDGSEYNEFFPNSKQVDTVIKKDAYLPDTIKLMMGKAFWISVEQTKDIAQILRKSNVKDTCENVWNFVYQHIQYTRDEKGKEQVRVAARTWTDRKRGVDCDCYTVFISSILYNLRINFFIRIAEYKKENGFQHVYPIVIYPQDPKGYLVLDCVLDRFNKEHTPFIRTKDYKLMEKEITQDNSEMGFIPILASLVTGGAAANAADIVSKGSGLLSKVGGTVQNVVGSVKNILGIGKNKEGADAAEAALAKARGDLQGLKSSMPQEIAQLEAQKNGLKASQEAELQQLVQQLNSI